MDLIEELKKIRIIPVVVLDDSETAVPVGGALIKGGFPCAEVTFRTDAAAESIRRMRNAYPQMLLGAGTVLTVSQAEAAMKAGADFIVSPGLNPRVVLYCAQKEIPILPGTATATEIEKAMGLGLKTVKFFPAEASGGVKLLKALSAPYPDIRFMPTGGIDKENICEYLSLKNVIACGGSWMADWDLIRERRFGEITRRCREAGRIIEANIKQE